MVLSSTTALLKNHDARSRQQFQAITTNHVGILSIANKSNNNVAVYDDHLLCPSIVLSNTIKRIVLLLATNSSNNSIQ